MPDRTLNARLRLTGGAQVRQAIDGTATKAKEAARDTRDAQRQAIRALVADVKKAEREKLAALRKTEREAVKATRDEERARKRAISAMVRDVTKSERQKRAEFERTARQQERAQRRQRISQMRGGGSLGSLAGRFAPLAVAGGAALGLQQILSTLVAQNAEVVRAVEAAGGVQDFGQRTVTAQDFDLELTRLGGEVFGELSPEERRRELGAVRDQINEIALATAQEPGQLLDALANLQTEFSAFDFGRANLRALADEAIRTGAPVAELARFAGLVRQQFGEIETNRIFDILAQGGLQGALDPESLSRDFSGQLGLFASFTDPNQAGTPEERLRSFVASANVLRQSGLSSNESATLMQNLFSSLSRERVQRDIAVATGGRRRGDRVLGGVQLQSFRDDNGRLDLAGFVEALEAQGGLSNLEAVQRAVGDQQASQALNTLIAARRRNLQSPDEFADIRELEQVSADAGARFRETNLADVRETSAFKRNVVGVRSQVAGSRGEPEASADAERLASLRRSLEQQGSMGRFIAESDTFSYLAGQLQESPTLQQLLLPQFSGTSSERFEGQGVLGSAFAAERALLAGPKGVMGGGVGKDRAASGAVEIRGGTVELGERTIEALRRSGTASPANDPRRSQSPRERG